MARNGVYERNEQSPEQIGFWWKSIVAFVGEQKSEWKSMCNPTAISLGMEMRLTKRVSISSVLMTGWTLQFTALSTERKLYLIFVAVKQKQMTIADENDQIRSAPRGDQAKGMPWPHEAGVIRLRMNERAFSRFAQFYRDNLNACGSQKNSPSHRSFVSKGLRDRVSQ